MYEVLKTINLARSHTDIVYVCMYVCMYVCEIYLIPFENELL